MAKAKKTADAPEAELTKLQAVLEKAKKAGVKINVNAFPKQLGSLIDAIYVNEQELVAKTKVFMESIRETELRVEAMRAFVMERFGRDELNGATGQVGKSKINQVDVPSVKNWDKVWAYIMKHKAFSLVQKRITTEAWRERVKAKQPVPGIDVFTVTTLSVTKR